MAELGAVHEFGRVSPLLKNAGILASYGYSSKKDTTEIEIPVRSFLREALLTPDGKKGFASVEYFRKKSFD